MALSTNNARLTLEPVAGGFEQRAMTIKTKHIAILPVAEDPSGALPAIVVPRLMRIQDAAKYLSATTWQVETLLREKVIPSFVLGKRRVVDRLELDRYVERRNAMARAEIQVSDKEETVLSLEK
jgi:excisionase family DNA binding protein